MPDPPAVSQSAPQPGLGQRQADFGVAVQLWYASASRASPGRLESICEDWLVPEERQRADRFVQPTTRNQHVVGRGMARRLLGGDRVAPHAIRLEYLPHGKPIVRSPEAARQPFNVAHTDGLVICGLGSEADQWIGVDVECQRRRTDPALAQRYFAKPEVDLLNQVAGEASRRELFLRIWTLKESFIKAIGTGLQTPLADFAFVGIDTETPSLCLNRPELDHGLEWRFRSLEPRPGYIAAVAVGTPRASPAQRLDADASGSLRVEPKSFEELLDRESPSYGCSG